MTSPSTALITGITGYLARHTAAVFLQAGWNVRGSLRTPSRANEVTSSLSGHLGSDVSDRLDFVSLDLMSDEGWREALEGIDVLVHVASPFPIEQPKDEAELIRPAVDGTLRALRAAHESGVERVVLTSSVAAISGQDARPNGTFDETDWTIVDHPANEPYVKSKTLAEQAAWDYIEREAPEIKMTTINPGFILGPPIGESAASSVSVIERVVDAKDPAVPKLGFTIVHVEDVALAHLRAAERPDTSGERIAVASDAMWFAEIAQAIKDEHPSRKVVTRIAPKFLLQLLAIFDGEIKGILPILGRMDRIDNTKARTMLDLDFASSRSAVVETANYVIDIKG